MREERVDHHQVRGDHQRRRTRRRSARAQRAPRRGRPAADGEADDGAGRGDEQRGQDQRAAEGGGHGRAGASGARPWVDSISLRMSGFSPSPGRAVLVAVRDHQALALELARRASSCPRRPRRCLRGTSAGARRCSARGPWSGRRPRRTRASSLPCTTTEPGATWPPRRIVAPTALSPGGVQLGRAPVVDEVLADAAHRDHAERGRGHGEGADREPPVPLSTRRLFAHECTPGAPAPRALPRSER